MEIKLHRQINGVPRGKGTEKVENSIKEKGCRSYGSTSFPVKEAEEYLFPLKCVAARHGR